MKWKTKEGIEIDVKDMETSHIQNALRMLRKKGFVSPSEVESFLWHAPPNGDMAQMAWSGEMAEVFSKPVAPIIDEFETKLASRK